MISLIGDVRTGFRIALREMRGSPRFFGVFLVCLVLGTGAVAGVGVLSESLKKGIRNDAKRLLGGDLEIRRSHLPLDENVSAFIRDEIGSGGDIATSVQARTMARTIDRTGGDRRLLVELKAVDEAYPLYGEVELGTGREAGGSTNDLQAALAGRDNLPGAVAAPDFFERTGAQPGDRVRIGDAEFVLSNILIREPDRAASFFKLGPRIMIHRSDLARTGVVRPGGMVRYVYSIRVGPEGDAGALKHAIMDRFPESSGWRIRDFSQSSGGLKRFIDNMGKYLLLVGLATLLTGGIGAANGVRRFLESRLVSIAAMKCVGADNRQVFYAYLVQILALAGIGSVIGVGAGWAAAEVCGRVLASTTGLPRAGGVPVGPLVLGLACGLLTALSFSLPVLSGAVRVSPVRLFSGYSEPGVRRCGRWAMLASACSVICMSVLMIHFTGSAKAVLGFAGVVVIGAGVLAVCAKGIRLLARAVSGRGSLRLRHAAGNLHRPGSATGNVLFSLGLGLTVITAVVQLEYLFDDRIGTRIPETAPAYFFLDVPAGAKDAFQDRLLEIPGVSRFDASPSIRGRIVAVNGVPADQVEIAPDSAWALRGDRSMSWAAIRPEGAEMVAGEWWPEDYSGPPLISFDAKVARAMGLDVGGNMTLNVLGREISAEVACLREIDWSTGRLDHAIVFSPGVLEGAPHTWLGAVYVDGAGEKEVFDMVSENYPSVSTVYLRDVLGDVQEMAGTVAMAVHAAAALALLSGLLILGETMRAGLAARHKDAVIFKVCGATRSDILGTLALEFTLLGCAAAGSAVVLGVCLAYGFSTYAMRMDWMFFPLPAAGVCIGGVVAVVVLGLTGVRRAVKREAWTVLRNE